MTMQPARAPRVETFKPAPALAALVTDIWAWEIPDPKVSHDSASTLTLLPDGHPTMCFIYGAALSADDGVQRVRTRSAVCGFQPRPVFLSCEGAALGLTVRLKPWGLASFLPYSSHEAAGTRIEGRDAFNRADVETLEDQLSTLPTTLGRVRCVEAFLIARLRQDPVDALVLRAVTALNAGDVGSSLRDLAHRLGTSERSFERRFLRIVGASPKSFARVLRMQQALQRRAVQADWAELALEAGYYDQAHLLRDARNLLGAPPRVVLAPSDDPIARSFQAATLDTALSATLFR